MKQIKTFLFFAIFPFCVALYVFGIEVEAAEYTNKQKMALLEPIEKHAMVYGEGERKVYLFIDPKCPHSQDFISMINENAKMRGIYRYYIFFYELKRFNSHSLIATIYGSSEPLQRTLEVMVGKKDMPVHHRIEAKIEAKIDDIAHVADQIGVSKRPYLIIAKELD